MSLLEGLTCQAGGSEKEDMFYKGKQFTMVASIKGARRTATRLVIASRHPFPLLLWAEWCLLGLNLLELSNRLLIDSWTDDWQPLLRSLLITAPLLCLFAGLGLLIAQQKTTWRKIAYTLSELGLLSLISWVSEGYWDYALLLVVVVIRSGVLFKFPGRLVTAGMALALYLAIDFFPLVFLSKIELIEISGFPEWPETMGPPFTESQLYSFMMQESFGRMLYFGVVLGFVLLLTNALTAERQGQQKLAIAHEQLRQYALQIEDQATLEERNRIAREIHDSLGHLLTAKKIQLNNALAFLPTDPNATKGRGFIQAGKQLGVEALQELRVSLKMLRSDPLKLYSLEQLLQQLIARFNHEMGLQIQQQIQLEVPVPNEIKRAVYRIVEEALNNIYKHSQAQNIILRVGTRPINMSANNTADNNPSTPSTELWLIITDDGQGFEMSQNTSGFGLRGMQERALSLGGQLTVDTQPGAGCQISGRLPIIGVPVETMP